MEQKAEKRRKEALRIAEACTQLLKERFGARRAIVFGSLTGQELWHEQSDIDLAVEGLTPEDFWRAWDELERLVPPWLEVDLVPLERVYPDIRGRILGEVEMPKDPYTMLKVRLEDEQRNLERVVSGVSEYLKRAPSIPEEIEVRGLASYVEDFYSGCERLFERVAVQLDERLPRGEDWHLELQHQMMEPVSDIRPAVISPQLAERLDSYRRFRHRAHHRYGFELEWERVLDLAEGMLPLFMELKAALAEFERWLESKSVA